ncbi:uncharacterized protein [Zea mays]|jgi:hypothetical protein|uniref:uncharacterized protein n=1 Tax=Zea mays TaxID=4577 RepID=UPI00022173EA|nr:uncharacterized protein LOC118473611 [Zea mays]
MRGFSMENKRRRGAMASCCRKENRHPWKRRSAAMADEGSARLAALGTCEQPLGSGSTSRRGQHRHGEKDEGRRRAHQQEGKEQGSRRWGCASIPWAAGRALDRGQGRAPGRSVKLQQGGATMAGRGGRHGRDVERAGMTSEAL